MNRLDPLIEELDEAVEGELLKYRDAGGLPQSAITFWVEYLKHMIKSQPKNFRDEIKSVVHDRICNMDDD